MNALNNTARTSTKEVPYNSDMNTKWHEEKRSNVTDLWNNFFHNMLDNATLSDGSIGYRMNMMLRRRIQHLCNENVSYTQLFISFYYNIQLFIAVPETTPSGERFVLYFVTSQ